MTPENMALKQFLVPLDNSIEGLSAFRFVLEKFGAENNILNILWLGEKCGHPEKAIDVHLENAIARLGPMNSKSGLRVKSVLEKEFPNIHTDINVISIDPLSRKQLMAYCSYSDIFFSTIEVFQSHIYPLFEAYSGSQKQAKISCPKILIDTDIQTTDNVVLVVTGQDSTISTVKQFCQVYSEKCKGKELNVLDLQKFDQRAPVKNSQKLLVEYLKNHISSPAIFPYSEEDAMRLSSILNLSKNTVWVSPLESVEELKFIAKKV